MTEKTTQYYLDILKNPNNYKRTEANKLLTDLQMDELACWRTSLFNDLTQLLEKAHRTGYGLIDDLTDHCCSESIRLKGGLKK